MKTVKLLTAAIASTTLSFVFATSLNAQSFTKLKATSQSKLYISGTSTLHDWKMSLKNMDCTAMGEKTNNNELLLKDIAFTAKVTDLKSNESSIMDKKAYKAMDEQKFPTISFTGKDTTLTLPLTNNHFKGTVDGWLTIAGKKNPVKINIDGNYKSGIVSIKGEYPLDTSSYGIKPVKVFFGALVTGNQIIVHFNILLQNN